jgi:hypothetical protein
VYQLAFCRCVATIKSMRHRAHGRGGAARGARPRRSGSSSRAAAARTTQHAGRPAGQEARARTHTRHVAVPLQLCCRVPAGALLAGERCRAHPTQQQHVLEQLARGLWQRLPPSARYLRSLHTRTLACVASPLLPSRLPRPRARSRRATGQRDAPRRQPPEREHCAARLTRCALRASVARCSGIT